jgi:uncharacterized membrane protein
VVMIEQMRNQMMITIMMLLMTIMRRMGTREVATETTTTVEKVVLVALWSVVTMMLPPLAMGMAYLVMLPKRNQLRKFPTKEYNFKTIYYLECQL